KPDIWPIPDVPSTVPDYCGHLPPRIGGVSVRNDFALPSGACDLCDMHPRGAFVLSGWPAIWPEAWLRGGRGVAAGWPRRGCGGGRGVAAGWPRRGCGVAGAGLRGGPRRGCGVAEAWPRGRRAGAAAGWRRSEAAGAARAQKKPADCGRLSRITPLVSSSIEGARAVRTDGYGHRHPGVRMSEVEVPGGVSGIGGWLDDRLHGAGYMRTLMRKVFPDHWSFLLGEIA